MYKKIMIAAAKIQLEGIVQGVGFRPFIHRLSQRSGLAGFTANTSYGVEIEVEGEGKIIRDFYRSLYRELPPLAKITQRRIKFIRPKGYRDFIIKESKNTYLKNALISPDIGICNDCLKELFTSNDRRHLYPFINCTNCGARFSIIQGLPYDRPLTTMRKFKLCPSCKNEYENILDRRYHAQPNACAACGPQVELFAHNTQYTIHNTKGINAVKETIKLLKAGNIVAIKGIGGFHIACDAQNTKAVVKLRIRKKRPFKPFAIMMRDLAQIKSICHVSGLEKRILFSPERPIVLLKKKINSKATETLAPNNNYLGVMLPYAPLHYLLFSEELSGQIPLTSLVATSGNIADEPIEIKNNEAVNNLSGICDYFLMHNRDIYNRLDDSIVQAVNNKPMILRRARGYCPLPFPVNAKMKKILGTGAELKNTFCLTRNRFAFLSQYIGDLKTYNTFSFYKQGISRFLSLFAVKPKIIAYDLHPDYLSTQYAKKLKYNNKGIKLAGIQHHQAHIASVIAEHRIKENVIGVSFDGVGYGLDGKIWGGEFFFGNTRGLKRIAHLKYMPMPGADKATQEPYRMAISCLHMAFGQELDKLKIDFVKKFKPKIYNIINLITNSPVFTSSAGRLFDAVSALLGICEIITYEAQAAIELQQAAEKSKTSSSYVFNLLKETGGLFIIEPEGVIRGIVSDLERRIAKEEIARKFHNGLIGIAGATCRIIRRMNRINTVALSGGVFQNKLLLEGLTLYLKKSGFKVYYNELLPINDGAISLGQAALANEINLRIKF